jgi:hypothetical protein
MPSPFALKQQGISPHPNVPEPIRLPSQQQHRATGHNPVLLRSKHDQNQPPVKAAKRAASIARPTLSKRKVPSIATRYSQQSKVRVLANGIAKFPVWASLQNKEPPIPGDGHTIHVNTPAHAHFGQYQADNQNQHIVDSVYVVEASQSDTGGFQLFLDREAAHGSSTSSGSTGLSDGSLSGDFEDKTNPNFTLWQSKILTRHFPVTFPSTFLATEI